MNGREWTQMDTQTLVRLLKAGLTAMQVAERMNRHERLVRLKARQLDIVAGQAPVFTAMMTRIKYRRRMARERA